MSRLVATKSADRRFHNIYLLGFGSYVGAVRELLSSVEKSAVIVSPYMDETGLSLLREIWDDRKHEESEWSVFVRDVDKRLLRAGRERGWTIYSYSPPAGSAEEYGLHAKMVSVDGKRAIIGSMNLLRRNLYSNLELGVELNDPASMWRVENLVRAFRRAGRRTR